MDPILTRLPLPGFSLPLGPLLLFVGLGPLALLLFGLKARARDLVVMGGLLTLLSSGASVALWGRAITLSAVPLHSYGVLLSLSLVLGWYLARDLARRAGLSLAGFADAYFVTCLFGLLGARLLYVLTNFGEFSSFVQVLALWQGGFVAYGGFAGGLVGAFWFLRRQGQRFLPWADAVAPSVALGICVTRLGCYLQGCDFGTPLSSEAPAVLRALGSFPRWPQADGLGAPAWVQHVNERGLSVSATNSLPVHPTQLYEAAAGALILLLLLGTRSRARFVGQQFYTLVFSYGCARFLIELVRGDLERGSFGPFVARDGYVLFALLAFALAFVFGPSRSIEPPRVRLGSAVAALLPAVALLVAGLATGFSRESIQLSTSQWIALFSVLLASLLWELEHKRRPIAAVERAQ